MWLQYMGKGKIKALYKLIIQSLLKYLRALIKTPIPLAISPPTYEICVSQFNLLSMYTPRNLVVGVSLMLWLSIRKSKWQPDFFPRQYYVMSLFDIQW